MKKYLYSSALIALMTLMTASLSFAQERADDSDRPSKNAESVGMIGDTKVRVTYGAPSVKGRDIFGKLEPYGKVWRAGANEATTVSFSSDVKVNGADLAAGTYSYFLIPAEEGAWTVIFNKEPAQWGAYDYDKGKDALRVMAETHDCRSPGNACYRSNGRRF